MTRPRFGINRMPLRCNMTTEGIPQDEGTLKKPGDPGRPPNTSAPQSGGGSPGAVDMGRRRLLAIAGIGGAALAGAATVATVSGYTLRDLVEVLWGSSNADELARGLGHLNVPLEELGGTEAHVVLSKRSITAVLSAILPAGESVQILGINALGPLHQAVEKLEEMLSRGKCVSIGVMNPLGDNFILREKQECNTQNTEVVSSRLSCEWIATFGILRQLYLRRGNGTLDAWMHPFYPHGSLVIVDDELVHYNPYKTSEALAAAADANLPRGITGRLEIYSRRTAAETVKRFCNEFRRFRASGQALDLRRSTR